MNASGPFKNHAAALWLMQNGLQKEIFWLQVHQRMQAGFADRGRIFWVVGENAGWPL